MLDALRQEILVQSLEGQPLAQIEEELIEPAPLDPEGKSALWLYAWSLLPGRYERDVAGELGHLIEGEPERQPESWVAPEWPAQPR